jgi:hypothetical protein
MPSRTLGDGFPLGAGMTMGEAHWIPDKFASEFSGMTVKVAREFLK